MHMARASGEAVSGAKYRCGIIPMQPTEQLVPALSACLALIPGICFTLEDVAGVTTAWDAVIFAASDASHRELVERICRLARERPECAILVAGGGFDAAQIGSLFAAGAHDFIRAPVSAAELRARLQRALGVHELAPAPRVLDAMGPPMRDFVGRSPAFLKQIAKLPTIAGCDAGVLILGETGTGKEVCAQAIHYSSSRASKPWVAVNCGAIPVELIESELFGHVRGAFTTASTSREGLISEAEGGTLFLDDIDCLPMSAQVKLLRFLQEREYRSVGANVVRRANARVIAASNRDLAAAAARGEFRRDLYFRLNVLTLTLPPLRDRREDIVALALHILQRFSKKHGRRHPALAPQAIRKLMGHDWPGNVRELQHVLERALLLGEGPMISAEDIDISGANDSRDDSFQSAKDRVVERFERAYIEQLLASSEGNVTQAAREAKKNRRAFFELMRKHGIEPQRFRAHNR
jgi:two-component system response regulator GlrR